ncbi:hypothetical protein MTP99_011146 [Tenebrio molitor]|nr:hypothetical protein MTP99_011146 [Tenebrio molitor]
MDYHRVKILREDPLKITRLVGCDIFDHPVVRVVLKFILVYYVAMTFFQIFYSMYYLEVSQITGYGPFLLMYPFFIICIITHLHGNYLLNAIQSVEESWSVDCAGKDVQARIVKESSIINAYAIANTILCFVAVVVFICPSNSDDPVLFPMKTFQERFPHQTLVLAWTFKLTTLVLSYVVPASCYRTIHTIQYWKFQICLLNKYVEALTDDYAGHERDLFYDLEYQERLSARIKFCIKRHGQLIRVSSESTKIMQDYIVPYTTCGCLSGVGVSLLLLKFLGEGPSALWRCAPLTIASAITFSGVAVAGQTLETESEEILMKLVMQKWYNWNAANKKMLLIAMANSMSPLQVKFSETFIINFRLGLGVCKMVYSVVSVFMSVFNK